MQPLRLLSAIFLLLAAALILPAPRRAQGDDDLPAVSLAGLDPPPADTRFAEPPDANRPSAGWQGIADHVQAITQGRVQIESGYTFLHDHNAGVGREQHVFPDVLLRVGLTERLEVRIGWAGYVAEAYDDRQLPSGGGWQQPTIGLLYDVCPQQDWIPQTGVAAAVPVAFQADPLAASSFQPLAQALYRWEFAGRWGLEGNTGVGLLHGAAGDFWQIEQTLNLDRLLSDRLDGFVEWQMDAACTTPGSGTQHVLSLGAGYQWTESLGVSVRAGVGLTPSSPDFLTGVRCSLRF